MGIRSGRAGMRAAALIAPAAAFFALAYIIPMIRVVQLSFLKSDFVTTTFVGVRNYLALFQDSYFLKSFLTSLCYIVLVVPPSIYVSYRVSLGAVALSRQGRTVVQVICYLPTLTAGIIISFVWLWVFGRDGLLASGFKALGIAPVAWFASGWTARVVISFSVAFSSLGGNCVWLSAILLSIPKDLYDQARIDGASHRQIIRYITGPIVAKSLMLLALLQASGAFQYWEFVFALTGGGPYRMTETPVYDIYNTAFIYSKHGMAAAKSIVLMLFIAALIASRKLLERRT